MHEVHLSVEGGSIFVQVDGDGLGHPSDRVPARLRAWVKERNRENLLLERAKPKESRAF